MPSKFPHGAVWWAAVTSAAVMAVIAAAFGITIWRYETAQEQDRVAQTALGTARAAGQPVLEFQDQEAAARQYLISPSAATLRQTPSQAGELAEAGPAAMAAHWPGPGGNRPAMGNGHVRTTVAVPSAGAAGPGGAR